MYFMNMIVEHYSSKVEKKKTPKSDLMLNQIHNLFNVIVLENSNRLSQTAEEEKFHPGM